VGVLTLGWPADHRFDEVELAVLEVIAHQCAVALDRARIEQVRLAERDALELLSEGTRLMVSALDPADIVESLVALAVPRLAPWCAVDVVEGHTLRRVAVEIAGHEDLARELRDRAGLPIGHPAPHTVAIRTGEVQVVPEVDRVLRTLYPDPRVGALLGERPWTGLAVPVKAAGEVIGVMSLASDRWRSTPTDDVRFVAEGLAARAGVALVNARRFEDERQTAALLMEAFLPARLPAIPGYEVAARYLPAGGRVAGDWYDVVPLPSGRYLVGIGDAGGHDIRAASLMGQLRNSARGLAMTGLSPAAVLDGLQLLTVEDGPDSFATAAYGVLDPATHAVRWAIAGHLPPLVFGPDGARFLARAGGAPLGSPGAGVTEQSARWGPATGVVLVTDGVLERRGQGLDDGLDRLLRLVDDHRALDATALTGRIVAALCPGAEDDCCVLVLRRPSAPGG
jgi:GAF domain-containing protein